MTEFQNIAQTLTSMAKLVPDCPAIYFPVKKISEDDFDYKVYSFKELDEKSHHLAKGLLEFGFTRGDRVALMVPPSIEFFALTFALYKAGLSIVLIDPGIGLKHLKTCLNEASPKGFIGVAKAQWARLLFGWAKKSAKKIIHVGKTAMPGFSLNDLEELGKKSMKDLGTTNSNEIAAILFTSGSTGTPKGAVYSHKNFLTQIARLKELYQITPGEMDLPTFPLFALFNPALGMTSVIPFMNFSTPAKVNPKYLVRAIERFKISNMFGSPALMNVLSRYCEKNSIELKTLKRVSSAGAPVQLKIIHRLQKIFSPETLIYTPYGATESLPVSIAEGREIVKNWQKNTQGAGIFVGDIIPHTDVQIIKIIDEAIEEIRDDLFLKPGEVGEIIVRADQVTRSYFNRESATKLAKIKDGNTFWHRVGDLGYFDDKKQLWFCGRKSHRVGNLYSECIEGIFNAHENVKRSALVGVSQQNKLIPVICLELEDVSLREQTLLEVKEIAKNFSQTSDIKYFLIHPDFPVDIRHNAKIFREKLAIWAKDKI